MSSMEQLSVISSSSAYICGGGPQRGLKFDANSRLRISAAAAPCATVLSKFLHGNCRRNTPPQKLINIAEEALLITWYGEL